MQLKPCLDWIQLWTPATPPASDNNGWIFGPIGDQLYLTKGEQLWFIKSGEDFSYSNWVKVSSVGLPSGAGIVPMALFKGQIYAAVYSPGIDPGKTTRDTFSIWRSPDVGKPVMQWTQVVSDGFNNPDNHDLAYMLIFNNKIIAVTTMTYGEAFGDERYYGKGIQVWESPSGDPQSWTQVNQNGFGAEVTYNQSTFLKNQAAGGCTIFKGYLFIGTMVHFGGADVWRYDGTGLNGWTKVTPPDLAHLSDVMTPLAAII